MGTRYEMGEYISSLKKCTGKLVFELCDFLVKEAFLPSSCPYFFLSARPHTAVPPDEIITSPLRPAQAPLTTRETVGKTTDDETSSHDNISGTKRLIFHDSDFITTQIVDNPKVNIYLLNPFCFSTKPIKV